MGAMSPLVFISYRRSDTQQAALGFYAQLRARLGSSSVFMDRSGIASGDLWSERLRQSVDRAGIVLALIGSNWLRAADVHGRRRLDLPDDWVRNELLVAIEKKTTIIPVLVGSSATLPPPEALPSELRPLLDYQNYSLRDDHWDQDLDQLLRLLTASHGFQEVDRRVPLPQPEVRIHPLTVLELEEQLTSLTGWEPVESMIPGDYPKSRLELRKAFAFPSFRAAIDFMKSAVGPINRAKHHPRWENQWRTVTVCLATWDVGFRITHLDIDLARLLDHIYEKQKSSAVFSAKQS